MANQAKILIVEDERGPRESLRMVLAPPHDVHTASDGEAALEILERNAFDLITLDLKMPRVSGLEVLEQIRRSNPEVMVIIVTGYGTFRSLAEGIDLDVFDYISKPFDVQEVRSTVERCLETNKKVGAIKRLFSKLAKISTEEPSEFHHLAIEEDLGHLGIGHEDFGSIKNGLNSADVYRLVSKSIEERDSWRAGHSERVSRYTGLLMEGLNLSHSVKEELKLASYLHDIGMVFFSNRLTNKTGELLGTDWALLRRHPAKSTDLLEPLGLSDTIMSAVCYHHERFDGTGYPDGLRGSDIPLGARIVSLGNAYDSLRSNGLRQNAMGHKEALAEIHKGAGTHFDPDLARTFLEVITEEYEFLRGTNYQREGYQKAS